MPAVSFIVGTSLRKYHARIATNISIVLLIMLDSEADRYLSVLFQRGNVRQVFIITSVRSEIMPVNVKAVNPSTAVPIINNSVPPINIVTAVITMGEAFRDLFRYLPVRDAIIWEIKHTDAAV